MIICGKVYIKNPIIIIYNITKNTIMEPFSITNIQQDEYRELQSAYHTMINALRKWETTGITYPTKVLKMIMTMRELQQTMLFLCGECEYELLEQNNTQQEEKRLTLLRKEREIIKKWCPYAFE
jgi:hypothetical protein